MRVLQLGLDAISVKLLIDKGFVVDKAEDVTDIPDLASCMTTGEYDALVINLDLQEWGPYVARSLRKEGLKNEPIIGTKYSADGMSWQEQRAIFLENSGDDLIQNPINPRELAASLRAVQRRYKSENVKDVYKFISGETIFKFSRATRRAFVNEEELHLTVHELKVLECLCMNAPRPTSKERILNFVYNVNADMPEIKIVDVYVCKLRTKLREAGVDSTSIVQTVWGQGYRMPVQA